MVDELRDLALDIRHGATMRRVRKGVRHCRLATSVPPNASADINTICARRASVCRRLFERTIDSSYVRTPLANMI
jgi:hypothetical protein